MQIENTKNTHSTVVCVTNQYRCERLIKAGKAIADITHTPLLVVNALGSEYPQDPQALQHLFNVSREHDSEMTVLYTDNAYKALVKFIYTNKAVNVITGMPKDETSVTYKLWTKYTHIKFFTVEEDGEIREVTDKRTHIAN